MKQLPEIIRDIETMPDLMAWHVQNLKDLAQSVRLPDNYEEIDWFAMMQDCGHDEDEIYRHLEIDSLKTEVRNVGM